MLRYILSLFDGMSCGQIALKELGIEYECYYASEIDKHAIRQTMLNFPATVQLGDVNEWKNWAINWSKVDLILAGSPCQGFSRAGKQLAFDDPRSILFFEFINILEHTRKFNPDVKFLLENVKMKREHMRVINEYVGIFPVNINSALVSAQNRDRLYWTDIRTKTSGLFDEVHVDIPQPEDEGIFLKDILDKEVDKKYYISQSVIDRMIRKKYSSPLLNPCKAGTLSTKNNSGQMSLDSGTMFISDVPKANLILQRCRGNNNGGIHQDKSPTLSAQAWEQNNLVVSGTLRTRKNDSGFREVKTGKAAPILARAREDGEGQNVCFIGNKIRRLTTTECDRLQTIPEWYKWMCSETQHYRLLGNGWTIRVITHLLKFLKE